MPHVAASLARFGWQQPIVARPPGEIVAGHTRLKAAQKLGMDRVPVVRFLGTDLDAAAYNVADNRTHEHSTWDDESLAAILRVLRDEDALEGVGFTDDEVAEILAQLDDSQPAIVEDPGRASRPWSRCRAGATCGCWASTGCSVESRGTHGDGYAPHERRRQG